MGRQDCTSEWQSVKPDLQAMAVAGASEMVRGKTTARGFEPLRAEPNGFLVHHLNHSVTLSLSSKG